MNIIPEEAKWKGPPSKERIKEIHTNYHYDAGDPLRGIKIGKSYGTLYHVTKFGLVPVKYSENGKEVNTVHVSNLFSK